LAIEKIATAIINNGTIKGIVSEDTTNTSSAPTIEPIRVSIIRMVKRLGSITRPFFMKGMAPPILKKVRANILVAMATLVSMPNWNITGTVINELLPVITPITAVIKK
jgi:hypothetical protein